MSEAKTKVKSKAATQNKRRRIEFKFKDKGAEKVFLAGDFNQWNKKSHPMKKSTDGIWTRSILVTPGRYEYKFFADGDWKEDDINPSRCTNHFGTMNSVKEVR
jgi:5'-AMP-activated protein kinase regulatory beta subunit